MKVASSEVHAHVVSVSEGTSRAVGPACSPCLACGGWLGCLCVSSRAREEGALCRTISENTAQGVPVSGLWDPRWIPRGGPAGLPTRSGAAHGPRGRWGAPSGGIVCARVLQERRGPSWEAPVPPLLSPCPMNRVGRFTSSLGLLWVCSSDFPVSVSF